jgi:hypothetical protein
MESNFKKEFNFKKVQHEKKMLECFTSGGMTEISNLSRKIWPENNLLSYFQKGSPDSTLEGNLQRVLDFSKRKVIEYSKSQEGNSFVDSQEVGEVNISMNDIYRPTGEEPRNQNDEEDMSDHLFKWENVEQLPSGWSNGRNYIICDLECYREFK